MKYLHICILIILSIVNLYSQVLEIICDSLKLSIVFFQFNAAQKFAYAPKGLDDGSLNNGLVSGSVIPKIKFDPTQWSKVVFK